MPFAIIGFFLGISHYHIAKNYLVFFHEEDVYIPYKSFSFIFLLVILCMIFARSAAMAFNRWADYKFDAKNERTKIREIPSGILAPKSVLLFIVLNCLLFIMSTYFINTICFFLSPVALLVILGYSYTKRFTPLCHLLLGLGLSLAPIGAYLSITGAFALTPLLFSIAVLCWVSGFDIIYALQDEEFDRSQNLKSIPVLLGKKNALHFSSILHVLSAITIIVAGYSEGFHFWYWLGTLLFIGLLIYQHSLVKPHNLDNVNMAFFTTNGIASVTFSVFFLLEKFL